MKSETDPLFGAGHFLYSMIETQFSETEVWQKPDWGHSDIWTHLRLTLRAALFSGLVLIRASAVVMAVWRCWLAFHSSLHAVQSAAASWRLFIYTQELEIAKAQTLEHFGTLYGPNQRRHTHAPHCVIPVIVLRLNHFTKNYDAQTGFHHYGIGVINV